MYIYDTNVFILKYYLHKKGNTQLLEREISFKYKIRYFLFCGVINDPERKNEYWSRHIIE